MNFDVQTRSYPAIVAKPVGTGGSDSYVLWYQGGTLKGTTGSNWVEYPWSPTLGRWYHLAFTYDNTTKKQVLYIDGVQVATGTETMAGPIAYDDHPVFIGDDINDGNHDAQFVGDIDEVRVWGTARSSAEIAGARAMCLPGDAAGLLGYWHFDEESGQLVNDSSTHGNAGYLGSSSTIDGADPTRVRSHSGP